MAKVLKLKQFENHAVLLNTTKQSLLSIAVSELKNETGIDFFKVAIGDDKEKRRLQFKHHQEKLLEG